MISYNILYSLYRLERAVTVGRFHMPVCNNGQTTVCMIPWKSILMGLELCKSLRPNIQLAFTLWGFG